MALVVAVPTVLVFFSPLLAWRDPVYILASVAGVLAMMLLLAQPLWVTHVMAPLGPRGSRRLHRLSGAVIVAAVATHVAALWLTSPPDVIDALTFTSPTPFSVWGVVAMWAVFAVAVLAVFRRRLGLTTWRRLHKGLAFVIASGTILHMLLIDGTLQTPIKIGVSVLFGAAMILLLRQTRW